MNPYLKAEVFTEKKSLYDAIFEGVNFNKHIAICKWKVICNFVNITKTKKTGLKLTSRSI